MLARLFLSLSLFFILLFSACQDTPQTNTQPIEQAKSTTTLPNSISSPTPLSSPQASTRFINPQTVLKQEEIKIGAIIPEIISKDTSGKTTVIAARTDKKGQLVMVYGPTCPICHETMPNVVNLYKSFFQGNNIPIIALSVQPQAITELSIKELNIPFNVVVMPEVDQKFGYKVSSIPTLMAIAPDGSIRGIWIGQIGAEQMTQIIKVFCPDCNIEVSRTQN
jgi:peroxiredoxin